MRHNHTMRCAVQALPTSLRVLEASRVTVEVLAQLPALERL